jgi:hypothetical protein
VYSTGDMRTAVRRQSGLLGSALLFSPSEN